MPFSGYMFFLLLILLGFLNNFMDCRINVSWRCYKRVKHLLFKILFVSTLVLYRIVLELVFILRAPASNYHMNAKMYTVVMRERFFLSQLKSLKT